MKKAPLFFVFLAFISLYLIYLYQSAARAKNTQIALTEFNSILLEQAFFQQRQNILHKVQHIRATASQLPPLTDNLISAALVDSNGQALENTGMPVVFNEKVLEMLEAALRGRTVVEIISQNEKPFWLVMQGNPQTKQALCLLFEWQPEIMLLDFMNEYSILLWLNGSMVYSSRNIQGGELPAVVTETVLVKENTWAGAIELDGDWLLAGAIPIKNYDAWDVTGVLMIAQPYRSPIAALIRAVLSPSAIAGLLALFVATFLMFNRLKNAMLQQHKSDTENDTQKWN